MSESRRKEPCSTPKCYGVGRYEIRGKLFCYQCMWSKGEEPIPLKDKREDYGNPPNLGELLNELLELYDNMMESSLTDKHSLRAKESEEKFESKKEEFLKLTRERIKSYGSK